MENQAIQKWYAKPQVIAIVGTVGYLLLNKKTRKTAMTIAGAAFLMEGIKLRSDGDGLSRSFSNAYIPAGAALLWYGLRKKK
jgi:hypothetical protein